MNYHVFWGLAQFFIICREVVTPTYMVLLDSKPSLVHYAEEYAHRFIFYDHGKQADTMGTWRKPFDPNCGCLVIGIHSS
jgi:hypothetical protein